MSVIEIFKIFEDILSAFSTYFYKNRHSYKIKIKQCNEGKNNKNHE